MTAPHSHPSAASTPADRTRQLLDGAEIARMLRRMAHEVLESRTPLNQLALVGIRTGGDYLAHQMAAIIGQITGNTPPLGLLDITLYRDDLDDRADQPEVKETRIPFDVAGRDILLVDDVLFTGRTIRSALNALSDFGRPNRVILAVLIDRGHRELPIRPDLVGKNIPTEKTDRVEVLFSPEHAATGVCLYPQTGS